MTRSTNRKNNTTSGGGRKQTNPKVQVWRGAAAHNATGAVVAAHNATGAVADVAAHDATGAVVDVAAAMGGVVEGAVISAAGVVISAAGVVNSAAGAVASAAGAVASAATEHVNKRAEEGETFGDVCRAITLCFFIHNEWRAHGTRGPLTPLK